jgi:hypothetical protein
MRLTGAVYAHFLNMELPHLFEDIPLIFRINQWFKHDEAPPHFSRNVQGILNRMYPNRWIRRGGLRHWPQACTISGSQSSGFFLMGGT